MLGCNGEIYNYKELIKSENLAVKTHSDCEVILHLFIKYGLEKTIKMINGEFAFFIFEIFNGKKEMNLYLGRDHCGIRPLFYGQTEHTFAFSSEMKGLVSHLGDGPK
ncbi:MAG: hypothetical protein DHS20C13_31090 [Thermodesulfobacteriota bacterium]|nr:MAG: hypothetical protein DHS20C13_31090 [Thermodesulfobacteriota bacterium]